MTKALGAKDIVLHDDAAADLAALDAAKDRSSTTNREKVRNLRPILLKDCLHGEVVPRKKIPRALRDQYDLDNLYVEDLADFWRLLYTIRKDLGERYVIVLRIVSHAQYDKWFAKRGK